MSSNKMNGIKDVRFCIGAGKFEGEEINWKYLDEFASFEEAKTNFDRYCRDYPASEFYVNLHFHQGNQVRIDIDNSGVHRLNDNGIWELLRYL